MLYLLPVKQSDHLCTIYSNKIIQNKIRYFMYS